MHNSTEYIDRSFRLVSTGWLPGWVGLAVFAALGCFVCYQLVREFAKVRTSLLTKRVLVAVRLLIVALLVWLACRPVMQKTLRWEARPELMVVVSGARSMKVVEEFGSLNEKISALEVLKDDLLPGRRRAPSQLARSVGLLAELLAACGQTLGDDISGVESALPLGPDFGRSLQRLRGDLSVRLDDIAAIGAELRMVLEDEAAQKALANVTHSTELLFADAKMIQDETRLVAREGMAQPQLVHRFAKKVADATGEARSLIAHAQALQSLLDDVLLGQDVIEQFRKEAHTRLELAELAAQKIEARSTGRFIVERHGHESLDSALAGAFLRLVQAPGGARLGGLAYIGDGSAPLGKVGRRALADLRKAGMPVHTVLVGADGIRPRDIGLIAVDLPALAVAGRTVMARALVGGGLGPDGRPKLVTRDGDTVLGAVDIRSSEDPTSVVVLSLVLSEPGRRSVVFEVVAGGKDAYAGNERSVTVVDVLPQAPRALIVSDRVIGDLAAYQQVLPQLTGARTETIMAEPGIGRIKVGSKPNEFPAKVDHWQDVSLAVLLGGIPEGLPDSALNALRQAVHVGLHVYIQAAAPIEDRPTWAQALGLHTESSESEQKLGPRGGYWPKLYSLAAGKEESLRLWRGLPQTRGVMTVSTPGFVLLECEAGPAVCTILSGRGMIVYNGLSTLASLRAGGNEAVANRILYGLLSHALRPAFEAIADGHEMAVLPPQPVLGKTLTIIGLAEGPRDLRGLRPVTGAPAGQWAYEVTSSDRIGFTVDGRRFERPTHKLLDSRDFELTPCAEVLREVSAATGGQFADLVELDRLVSGLDATPAQRSSTTNYRLWSGCWPLLAILALVCSEYLLRRRAGRVM